MKKFVVVLALVAFSGSVFAQIKPVRETSEGVKKLLETKKVSEKKGEELNKTIAELLKVETFNPNVEGMTKGLDHVFGAEDIVKKIEFAGKIKTMLEISDKKSQEYKMGFALANILSRIDKMTDAGDRENAAILVKNHAFLGEEAAVVGFARQARAFNYLTYKKYDAPVAERVNRSAEEIVDIAALNVVESKLGVNLEASKRDGIILSLDGLTAEKRAELKKESEFWKINCNKT